MTSEELDIYLLALEIYYDMIIHNFPEDLTKELHEFIIGLEKRWVTIDGRHVNIGGDESSSGGSSGNGEITYYAGVTYSPTCRGGGFLPI